MEKQKQEELKTFTGNQEIVGGEGREKKSRRGGGRERRQAELTGRGGAGERKTRWRRSFNSLTVQKTNSYGKKKKWLSINPPITRKTSQEEV